MDAKIFSLQGKEVGQLSLDPALWDGPVNTAVLVQAVAMYRTNVRAGLASTKTRGDVSGGGKKPWKQKHTGRARAGSTRSPLWRHGGSVFGPRRRDMSYRLPQTIRRIALLESLKGKLRDQELVVLEQLEAASPKTKPFGGLAKTFKAARASVIVLHEPTEALLKSLRNLASFELRQAANLNAFDVLNAHKVLVTTSAFEQLEQRVKEKA
ncbi:MAG: 50S ribosomal protein L4 [Omnitrophica WOR_2 bacterium RIFCSPHIGHO2_02_FULL_67_20]|nr:MAG: 50S ribosomal protein L4 [Omnitrophica WOR_2 bacterium RIFCSPHIGHO2_02_FULL_67_20]